MLKVGIVGLPNAGPKEHLLAPEVYVLASQERVFGAALSLFLNYQLF
jgi:hypothetical protein